MTFAEKIKEHWITFAGILTLAVAGTTFAVVEGLRIAPLKEQLELLRNPSGQVSNPANPNYDSSPIAAGAFIVERHYGKPVLLGVLQSSSDGRIVFSPPAGESEANESPSVTAVRETLEETGYTVIPSDLLGNAPDGNPNFSLVHCTIDHDVEIRPVDHEAFGIVWTNPHDIPSRGWRFPDQRDWVVELYDAAVRKLTME